MLLGRGDGWECTASYAGAPVIAKTGTDGSVVGYLVPSLTHYRWVPTQRDNGAISGRLVNAGLQKDGQNNYVCRARDSNGVLRAGKSDGSVCWVWDGSEAKRGKDDGFEFLVWE
jgi:hypothetical protein